MAAAGAATSALIFPIIFFLWGHMQLEGAPLNSTLAKFGLHGTSWLLFIIYFSTAQPFLEELYWRGYLQGNHKHFSWTDFAFAGYHILVLVWFIKLPWLIIAFIVLAAAAYTWRHIASKLDGLMVPLISHIVADISIVTATYVLIQ